MKKILFGGLAAVVVVAVGAGLYFKREIDRASFAASLFSGAEQYENFNRMAEMFPVATMPATETPFEFGVGERIELPSTFDYKGDLVDTEAFLSETDTSALLVIENGEVRFERYMLTGGRDVNWMSMSVAKSFVSAAVGIAVEEGNIKSIEEPITA